MKTSNSKVMFLSESHRQCLSQSFSSFTLVSTSYRFPLDLESLQLQDCQQIVSSIALFRFNLNLMQFYLMFLPEYGPLLSNSLFFCLSSFLGLPPPHYFFSTICFSLRDKEAIQLLPVLSKKELNNRYLDQSPTAFQ